MATLTIENLTKVFPPPRKDASPVTALGGLSFESGPRAAGRARC